MDATEFGKTFRRISAAMDERLLQLNPHPFGLVQEPAGLSLPGAVGNVSYNAGIAGVFRTMLRKPALQVESVSIRFGWMLDTEKPLVEVTTHWRYDWQPDTDIPDDFPGRRALGAAEHRDDAIRRGAWQDMYFYDHPGPTGPFQKSTARIVVSGHARDIEVAEYQNYKSFYFREGKEFVLVVGRNMPDDDLHFDHVDQLEEYLANSKAESERLRRRFGTDL